MKGVNKVILVGTLGMDPEVKYLDGGKALAKLSLATSETWKDKNTGEKKEETQWHRVILFGSVAEIAEKYLNKGSKIYLEGKLKTRQYEKDGGKRFITEVIGSQIQFIDTKKQGSSYSSQGQANYNPKANNEDSQFNDDIPF